METLLKDIGYELLETDHEGILAIDSQLGEVIEQE